MNSIVIFYNDNDSKYKDEKAFGGKSAVEKTEDLYKKNDFRTVNGIFTIDGPVVLSELLEKMTVLCEQNKADFVIFSYNDLPFLDSELINQLIDFHTEYKSEYTFADGYPYGFAPELIDSGTLKILLQLSKTTQSESGNKVMNREGIYNLIKTDINSFEVETVLSPNDWRLYRFAFDCRCKDNFLQSKALFEKTNEKKLTADEKANIASKTSSCLKTVPGFYNIQISQKNDIESIYLPYKNHDCGIMNYDNFASLVDKIAAFSERAVISLSAWGEPLSNPECLNMIKKVLSYDGLSVFLETNGLLVTEDFCRELSNIVNAASERKNGWQKVMIAVTLDAVSQQVYSKLHKSNDVDAFSKAVESVSKLAPAVPEMVYPQFVRMNENEDELEAFYRYWNEKSNPSNGKLIIQKYDDFAGLLPQCKPADLAPLERLPCWHLRRDFTILYNGDVPPCRTFVTSGSIGNVFEESIEKIWNKTDDILNQHIAQKYNEKCGKCDESYTFNF